jgi:uncharacterized membrane protein
MLRTMFSTQPKIYKHWFFFTFLMGVGLVFLIPPFQSPDEFNHFYRIYQISDGQLLGELNSDSTKLGGYIPNSLVDVTNPFKSMIQQSSNKTSFDTIIKYLSTPLEKDKKIFEEFPNTARYSVTAYLPQVLTIGLLKQFDVHPLCMMYLGRLMNFLFWFLLVNIAVQKTPVFKELIMCFLLLPASLAINGTLNADVTTNAIFFMLFTLFFRFRHKTSSISFIELSLFTLLFLLTTINKICYLPALFLLLLIKKEQFGSLKLKISYISVNLILNLGVAILLSNQVHHLVYPNPENINWTTYENSLRPGYNVNPELQTRQIMADPFLFLKNLVSSSAATIRNSSNSWVGGYGWESALPSGLLIFFWYFLAVVALFYKYDLKIWERCGLAFIGFGMTILFLLSTHLHWDGVGDFIEHSWGGKYFIPIFPLYFWAIAGLFSKFLKQSEKVFYSAKIIAVVAFIVIYVDFWILLFERYYIFPK